MVRRNIPVELTGNGKFLIPRDKWTPAYLQLFTSGELQKRAELAKSILTKCNICPRNCRVNRSLTTGFCKVGTFALVSSAFPHLGEEDCLRGWRGSGTIFFSHCNLKCVFCQNYELSHFGEGKPVDPQQLAKLMLTLQEMGCHNINFVTPTHVVPQILEALLIAIDKGFRLPLVYNCGGYENISTLRLLDGVIDIYMPDFKFWDETLCELYINARDYSARAREALLEMHRQVGPLMVDENGLALRGVLVRHLVMPGLLHDTEQILHWIATAVSTDTYVNIMDQYRPVYLVKRDPRFHQINRPITPAEFHPAIALARKVGLWRLDTRWR